MDNFLGDFFFFQKPPYLGLGNEHSSSPTITWAHQYDVVWAGVYKLGSAEPSTVSVAVSFFYKIIRNTSLCKGLRFDSCLSCLAVMQWGSLSNQLNSSNSSRIYAVWTNHFREETVQSQTGLLWFCPPRCNSSNSSNRLRIYNNIDVLSTLMT